jgi:hypothetical protein
MRGIMGFIEHSENTYHLESALQKAQHVMPRVRRNSTGEYGKYVSLGAFLDAVAKPLHENGIFYCQFVSGGRDGGTFLTTRLSLPVAKADGGGTVEWMQSSIQLDAMGDAQSKASELTLSRKHHLASLLGVAWADESEDDGQAAAEAWRAKYAPRQIEIYDKADEMLKRDMASEKRKAIIQRLQKVVDKGDLPKELLEKLEAQNAQ